MPLTPQRPTLARRVVFPLPGSPTSKVIVPGSNVVEIEFKMLSSHEGGREILRAEN